MDPAARQFASCESRVYLSSALVYVLLVNYLSEDTLVLLFWLGLAVWLLWIGFRSWGKPCAWLGDEHLAVFNEGRLKHYIALSQIAGVRSGLNCTILQMCDGFHISISPVNFLNQATVREFRATLAERLPTVTVS